MKKKLIFAIATGFFAVATVLNMNMLQTNSTGDVSLESIAVMAQAQDGEDSLPDYCIYAKDRECRKENLYFQNYRKE